MKVNPQERAEQAREYFTSGYNCAQSVFLAYQDITGIDEVLAATISAPFGGGMGRLREVCGAVSGMTMVAGFIAPNSQPNDNENKKNCYATVQALAEEFRAENGSIVCRELLNGTGATSGGQPEARTDEYYKKRPCAEIVKLAVRILADMGFHAAAQK